MLKSRTELQHIITANRFLFAYGDIALDVVEEILSATPTVKNLQGVLIHDSWFWRKVKAEVIRQFKAINDE